MRYTLETLPEQVKQLNMRLQTVWYESYRIAIERGANDIMASRVGWDIARRVVDSSPIQEFSLYIAKANVSKDGQMQFLATASDTKPDVFTERMSLELFQSFVNKFTGMEFVSLAHYPRLRDGFGELGLISKIYLDGDYLKVRGYFHDTILGRKAFEAILADRKGNIPVEKRIRVSIGFWDRLHKHTESGYIAKYELGKECPICAMGKKNDKIYLDGILDHIALTKIPANRRTDIDVVNE